MVIVAMCVMLAMCVFLMIALDFSSEIGFGIGLAGTLISGVVIIVLLVSAILNHIGAAGQLRANVERYNSLVYQASHNLYDNDNDFGKKELANQITEYNAEIAKGKALQRDFWVGVLYPNIYDDAEIIPIDLLK